MLSATDNRAAVSNWRYQTPAVMSPQQFAAWTEMLEQRTGVVLPEARRSFLLTSLAVRMRELGVEDYDTYFAYIQSGVKGQIEWETLVDRLTVHETRFFRDQQALDLICNHFLQPMVKRAEPIKLHCWSVGCATGEEPYSLAMAVDECLGQSAIPYRIGITAIDISQHALSLARRGEYRPERLRGVTSETLERYFEPTESGRYRVKAAIRERIGFTRMNILDIPKAPIGMMDIVLCQNVLIYFRRDKRAAILDTFVQHLNPGGLLILGAGEVLGWSHPQMQALDANGLLVYRRKSEGAAA